MNVNLLFIIFLQIVGHTLGIHMCDVKCGVIMSIKSKTTSPLFGSYDYFSRRGRPFDFEEGGDSFWK